MAITNVEIVKPIVSENIVTSLGEFSTGDHIVLKGDGSSDTAEFTLNNAANTFGTKIKSANVSSDITFTLPTADGSLNQVLRTDGNGVLSFVNDADTTVLVEDVTPQLSGNLDVNSNSIVSVSNGNISFLPDGSGKVLVDGDGTTGGISLESGSIDVKNSGAVSSIRLYCESSNLHYTQIQSAPHSSYSGNVTLTLPTTSGTLLLQSEAQNIGGGVESFVATGSISSGDIVGLRSDGTVEVIAEDIGDIPDSASSGTPSVFAGDSSSISATFDSNSNKVVIAYRDSSSGGHGYARIGTVSGSSISFGSNVRFEEGNTNAISATFDSNTNTVVIAYTDSSNFSYGTAVVGTVSGTSISFGTPVVFRSSGTSDISTTFDSNSNKVVIAYRGDSIGFGTAIVGTVSGTSISFGTKQEFQYYGTSLTSSVFDSNSNKVVIAHVYVNENGNPVGSAAVGTVSGTSISFGTPVSFNAGTTYSPSATFDSNSNKVVIAFRDNNNNGYVRVGNVSGSSISFGSSVSLGSVQELSSTFDSNKNKVVIAYKDISNSNYGTAVVGNVSGTSISLETPVVFEYANADLSSSTFDSNVNKVVIAYRDVNNAQSGTAVVFETGDTGVIGTNADTWIGIAAENISDTASGKINILGGVSSGLSSLTVNTDYYVNYDGTLTATENAGPLTGTYGKIGKAISTTKLLITEGT
jgi:hypothetical protein